MDSGNQRVYESVTFILIMHTYGYVSEVEQYVREIDGVESVKGDTNSNKLEVKGKAIDENERPEEELKEEKTRPESDYIANMKSEENMMVLKINLSCDDCNQTLKKILKVNGLEMVAMDMEKDLVTLKGTVSMTELRSYIKRDFKVMVPAKKDIDPTEKKGRETGANGKKETDAGAVDKKGKEVGVAEMIIREKETEPTYKKSKGKDAGAIDKKGKEVGAKKIKDRDSEPKGSAGMDNKSENKDCGVNLKKDRDDGHRKNEEASSDVKMILICAELLSQTSGRATLPESVTVLKIKLCCDSCNQKLQTILKDKGLEMVAMDTEKDLVTIKGTVSMTQLRSYITKDFEVVVPAKKDSVPTEKKGRETGAIGKKEKDAGAVGKKGKEVGAAEMIMRENRTEPTYKKSKGKDAGAMDKKGNEVGATKIGDKDSGRKGSAGVDNKSENKDSGVNPKKDKEGGHRKNEEQYLREIDGVESKGDINSNKLEVKGKANHDRTRRMVKCKTKTKVKHIFPLPEIEGYGDENERPEEKLEEKTKSVDNANKKSEESVTVLKIKLCCDSCNQKLQTNLKGRGLEMVAMDTEKDLVTVKGTVSMTELRSYITKDFEVVVPAKKDSVPTEKKGRETGAIGKKEKDAGAVDKKGKEAGAAEMIMRENKTEPTYKKSKGKDADAMDKKGKEVGAKKIRDKDSEPKSSAGVDHKSEYKDSWATARLAPSVYSNTGYVNQKIDKDGHRKNEEASSGSDQLILCVIIVLVIVLSIL
ncbi:hypothetical protein EZV62_016291 [Acer yangbiense]|uniref:HMA domain-containing protein n=1 Tax=Acer yangbiense TaxID=1000413 RepID=A0A5C7HQG0_9ROSI|nr:hypothetical protein EZV62_016291 [Acer yangbiense]